MRTELYRIEGPWSGRLAIVPRPRGGDWLEDEIASWRRVGIDIVVSAMTEQESVELDLAGEKDTCVAAKIAFVSFPIEDRGTPPSRKAALELVRRLEQELALGKKIVIHCRQGVGRSALLATCVLAASGVDPASAWERIAAARGCLVPDTNEQKEWVTRFVRESLVPLGEPTGRERERGDR